MDGTYQVVESSSDEASEGENEVSKDEEEAELTGGAQGEGEPSGSDAWATGSGFASGRAGSEEDEESGSDDGGMASAVASASHQARIFLEDSDSEEEEEGETARLESSTTDLQKVFGDDSDEEETTEHVGGKRGFSSDREEEEEEGGSTHKAPKRIKLDSDEESEGEKEKGDEEGGGGWGEASPRKKGVITIESDEEEEEEASRHDSSGEVVGGASGAALSGGESEGEEEEEEVGREELEDIVQLQEEVAGDEEEEEEEDEEEEEGEGKAQGGRDGAEGGEGSDDEVEDDKKVLEGMSDWDVMMMRRKEAMARARKRRKHDGDITINDDHVMALVQKMREAAQEDRQLNLTRKAATKKIQLLPTVMAHLKKVDLQTTLMECGILSALAEWLTPLPDHSLPHLKIRTNILDVLKSYPIPDSTMLKSSKIGKAVMLVYRHPKEAKKNREKAGKIINDWARPIFGLASDFKSMTRDEREERDYANLSQEARKRISTGERGTSQDDESEQPQKPGDKGWIGRARVPMPSTKGYVVRPKWNVNAEQTFHKRSGGGKRPLNRYEKQLRKTKQEKMAGKVTHAVPISVEGRHMPL